MWREGEVVKQGERLCQERREVCGADPGRQGIQEALQRLLVRLGSRAAQGALEQRGDKLHDERVGGRRYPAIVSLPLPVMVSWRGYSTPLTRTHGVG